MTREQARLLRFALKYPGWHSAGADVRPTVRTLERHGLLETTGAGKGLQFRVALAESTRDAPALVPDLLGFLDVADVRSFWTKKGEQSALIDVLNRARRWRSL